eukprot:CAMPEP_0184973222 /NCGR_PEP_ID=MMETSP1098-20130426/5103_1 /TAXON_ID=89044 /ORGANISM="Spumella elongata, Strain CCAP 955/1" /LENGTH=1187 /DNA_ID=CAMNT_0027495667 /DNA_START=491 /DNA_END=4054 /DNA_ORIENTATION=-
MSSLREQRIVIPTGTISAMYAEYSLVRPKASAGAGMSSTILPLFDTLGTERFFKLLSAVLCEKRIVFIAEEAETLSATVLAAASMLHPFKWHHAFIPLLPGKLLNLLQTQTPYMIGVRKYLLSELRRESLDGTVVIDCDTGDVRLQGQVHVRDLIGDAATARKQASESIDQMKAKMSGMASMFMGKATDAPSDVGPKDLMVVLLSDLKSSVTSTKPSSYSISSLLSGGGGTHNRSAEEAKVAWAIDAEKALRDNLTCFFVYFFADLEEYMTAAATAGGVVPSFGTIKGPDPANRRSSAIGSDGASSLGDLHFPADDSRSNFDLRAFMAKRTAMGDSKQLLGFISDFLHSQIFERFCAELIAKKQAQLAKGDANKRRSLATSNSAYLNTPGSAGGRGGVNSLPTAASGSLGGDEEPSDDPYEKAVLEWAARGQALTIANAKIAVAAASPASMSASKDMGSNFHNLVVQFTSGATPLAPCEVEIDRDSQYYTSYLGVSNASAATDSSAVKDSAKRQLAVDGILRKIVADASHGDEFVTIMRTVYFRLQGALATGGRGQPGVAGVRALILCRHLLVEGPECTVSHCTDFIPMLRALLRLSLSLEGGGNGAKKTSKQQQALDYMSLGAFMDPTLHAKTVLDLIIDHKKLMVQRKVALLLKKNSFPFLTTMGSNKDLKVAQFARTEMLFSASFSASKLFPRFDALHKSLNPLGIPSIAPGSLSLSTPELAVGAAEERLGGDDEDEAPGSSFQPTAASPASSVNTAASGANSPGRGPTGAEKFLASQADEPFAPTVAPAAVASPAPKPSVAPKPASSTSTPFAKPAAAAVTPSATSTPAAQSAPSSAAKYKQRFIYEDEEEGDAAPSAAPAAFAPSVPAAAPAAAAFAPSKPAPAPRQEKERTVSPFKVAAPAAAPADAFAPTQPSAAQQKRQSVSVSKLAPPPPGAATQKRPTPTTSAVDLLDMPLPSAQHAPSAASDPFGSDPFLPSFPGASAAAPAPAFAPSVDPFTASFAPSTPAAVDSFAPSTSHDAFAPSVPKAQKPVAAAQPQHDAFAPSPAGWSTSSSPTPLSAASPFDDFAPSVPTPAVAAADPFQPSFAPSRGSGNFSAQQQGGFAPSFPGAQQQANNAFAPSDFASSSSFATQPTAGNNNGYGFIHTKPPAGGVPLSGMPGRGGPSPKPAADPFDFLNPIKK